MRWAGSPGDVVPVEGDPAGGRRHEARDGPGEGALSGPVHAQHGQDRPWLHLEGDPEQRLGRAVADVEIPRPRAAARLTPRSPVRRRRLPAPGPPAQPPCASAARRRRGTRRARRVSLRTSSGVPTAIRSPKSSTTTESDSASTAATSCSTMTRARPSSLRSTISRKTRDQVLRAVEVESRQRLVEEEDLRLAGQRPGHLDEADHPEGQRSHGGLGHMGQVEEFEQPVDLVGLAGRGAEQGRRVRACPATSGRGATRAR